MVSWGSFPETKTIGLNHNATYRIVDLELQPEEMVRTLPASGLSQRAMSITLSSLIAVSGI